MLFEISKGLEGFLASWKVKEKFFFIGFLMRAKSTSRQITDNWKAFFVGLKIISERIGPFELLATRRAGTDKGFHFGVDNNVVHNGRFESIDFFAIFVETFVGFFIIYEDLLIHWRRRFLRGRNSRGSGAKGLVFSFDIRLVERKFFFL